MIIAATRAAAPFALRRGEGFFVPPQRGRTRAHAVRAGRWPPGRARAADSQAAAAASSSTVKGRGQPELPRSSPALRVVGAGVALASCGGARGRVVGGGARQGRRRRARPAARGGPGAGVALASGVWRLAGKLLYDWCNLPMKKRLVAFMDELSRT